MDRPGLVIGQLFFYVLLFAVVIWLVVSLARRSGKSSPSHARWQHAVQICSTDPRFRLAQVTSLIQTYPQRGTAAWVTWYGSGQPQSTWFEQAFPPVGAWVVVSGTHGSSVPHADPATFYVDRVHDVIAGN